jgi:predicted DNA-binding helix-hairpin-helix protein
VPGIGPQSADKIVAARRQTTLRDLGQLQRLGVTTKWAAPFIVLDGKRPSFQLALW